MPPVSSHMEPNDGQFRAFCSRAPQEKSRQPRGLPRKIPHHRNQKILPRLTVRSGTTRSCASPKLKFYPVLIMLTNQKCLFAIWLMILILFTLIAVSSDLGLVETLRFISPVLIIGLIPFVMAFTKKHEAKKQRRNARRIVILNTAPRGFSEFEIHSGDTLPAVCVTCGEKTFKTTPIRHQTNEKYVSKYDWKQLNPFFAIIFLLKFAAITVGVFLIQQFEKLRSKKKAHATLEFLIPHCPECAKKRPIPQRHLDFHGRKIIIFVHPHFPKR